MISCIMPSHKMVMQEHTEWLTEVGVLIQDEPERGYSLTSIY